MPICIPVYRQPVAIREIERLRGSIEMVQGDRVADDALMGLVYERAVTQKRLE